MEIKITREREHIVQSDCPRFHFFAVGPTVEELQLPPNILRTPKISGNCCNKIRYYIEAQNDKQQVTNDKQGIQK